MQCDTEKKQSEFFEKFPEEQEDIVNAAREEALSAEERKYEVMTFEEYAEKHHDTPYLFEVRNKNKLVEYFGAEHSNDPQNPMFEHIEEKFKEANPQVVFVEGVNTLAKRKEAFAEEIKKADRDTVIEKMGESGFALKLAVETGADIISPEPDFRSEIEHLIRKGYGKEEIFAYYMYRTIEQYHRNQEKLPTDEYLTPYLNEFREASAWPDFDYSLEHLQRIGTRIWGEKGDMLQRDGSRTDPTPREVEQALWTPVNDVAQQSGYFRDKHIVGRIEETMKEKDRLFVVFGASHAVMQEPALRKVLEKKENTKDVIYKRTVRDMRHEFLALPKEWGVSQKKEHMIENITWSMQYFPQCRDDFENMIAKLQGTDFADDKEFVRTLAEDWSSIMVRYFTLPELEQHLIEAQIAQGDRTSINRVLMYERAGNELRLHTPTAFLEDRDAFAKLYKEGLQKLATLLRDNAEFRDVTTLTRESWLIFERQKQVRELGFTITNLDPGKHVGSAEMSKEKLFELYLPKE